MKGINGKQLFTTVILFAVLIVVAVYFLFYQKNMDKKEALIASNETLKSRVEALQVYYDNQVTYIEDMEKMKPEIDTILSKYVSDVREEDQIMQAVISQRLATVQYDSINLANKKEMLVIPAEIVQGANIEKYQKQIVFEEKTTTYNNKLDYHNLKTVIQSIFDSEYNIGIKTISYGKATATESTLLGILDAETGEIIYVKDTALDQEVGILEGTIDLEFYCVAGNGVEYTKPDMKEYLSGTEDFFALAVPVVEDEEEDGSWSLEFEQ